MHHARNLSDASNASSQSTMSVISDGFEASVRANMEGPRTNEFLILAAKDHLLFFQAKAERLNPTPSTVDPGIDPARILHAMLEHAVICGPGSQRYTACCIITCDEKVEELVELANTWVRYLLWPFKCNSDRRSVPGSEIATPTAHVTEIDIVSASANRRSDFAHEVLARDGYRCVATGFYDIGHVPPHIDQYQTQLEAAHILKRAVAVFPRDKLPTVSLTWDIIKQYAAIPDAMINTMNQWIDDPQNGIALQKDAHTSFDMLTFTFLPQEDGSYKIQQFGRSILARVPQPIIRFHDHSPYPGTSLPSRTFLALHAAIASVLHMSGAGEVLESIMNRFSDAGTRVPSGKVRTGEDLDLLLGSLKIAGT